MPDTLGRLRANLDFMPSPVADRPGLFIRDPYRFSDAMLVIPPALVTVLDCFDGRHTELDLRAALARMTNSLEVGEIVRNLVDTLSSAGFLEDERFETMKADGMRRFASAPVREAAHADAAYPADRGLLRETMERYMTTDGDGRPASNHGELFAVAAPHVSPDGGWRSYRDAYRMIGQEYRDRTFVILATSHYGEPEKFGLTRKPFRTPLGVSPTDATLVDWLEQRGGAAVSMEDYCHSFEHTVELQVVFLQHALGPGVKILPILCGPFVRSLFGGGAPEDEDGVKRFLGALAELREREGRRLFWILGVDMAHMGARYSDPFTAIAGQGRMEEVAARDEARIARLSQSDAAGFWDLVRENRDDLKWCGSAPFYAFLKTAPEAKGELLRYEQWNIDDRSVVSFGAMAFRESK